MVIRAAESDFSGNKQRGVQSLHRALDLLEIISRNGSHMAIGEAAAATNIPLPTIHRLLQTLAERGYVRQLPDRQYALGFRLIPLGIAANALIGANAGLVLARLVTELGETANLSILSGNYAVYVAQAPSPHAMRMFTEVGHRVALHCTGVGKALLSGLEDSDVAAIIRQVGLPRQTENTITTEESLHSSLAQIRHQGYAVDDEEQEIGVRCVAVLIPGYLTSRVAISVSGPVTRMTEDFILRAVNLLHNAAHELSQETATTPEPLGRTDTVTGLRNSKYRSHISR